VDREDIHPDPAKVQALAQWLAPTSTLHLKSFMGGINFYCKFVSHFSQLARPLHHLANLSKFVCPKEAEQHFTTLKHTLCSAPVWKLPNFQQLFDIEIEASHFSIGVVLKQGGHLVAYHSEALTDTKLN